MVDNEKVCSVEKLKSIRPVSSLEQTSNRYSNVRTEFIRIGIDTVLSLADSVDEEILQDALANETQLGTIVSILSRGEVLAAFSGAAKDSEKQAERIAVEQLRLRTVRNKERLLTKAGGTISTSEVAARLGMTPQGVTRRRKAGSLIAVELGKHQYRYPVFQFALEGGVIPGLEDILDILSCFSPWAKLSFLLSENPRLEERTPYEMLLAGDLEQVKNAALAYGEHGAA